MSPSLIATQLYKLQLLWRDESYPLLESDSLVVAKQHFDSIEIAFFRPPTSPL